MMELYLTLYSLARLPKHLL